MIEKYLSVADNALDREADLGSNETCHNALGGMKGIHHSTSLSLSFITFKMLQGEGRFILNDTICDFRNSKK